VVNWLSLPIRRDADVVAVRSRVRALAEALPIALPARARLVAAASELARWCVGAPRGNVAFGWDALPRTPWVEFTAGESLPRDVGELMGRLASSDVSVERQHLGSVDRVVLRVASRAPDSVQPENLRALLLQGDDATAIELLREQNREMARLLLDLRTRDDELARALEEARLAANKATENAFQLAELYRRKDEILAIVSHDIRSPLAAVRGALSMLQGSIPRPDADQMRLIAIANRAGDAIVELVSNVLTSALLDVSDVSYEPLPVDVASIATEVGGGLGIVATQKGVRLDVKLDDDAIAAGDPTWVRQMLSNLVMNAIKFTDRGGEVSLRVGQCGGRVQIEVRDTGVGIPSAKRSQLFQKGQKLRAGGTAGERGTGLGLYITRQLVERMSGVISFDSEEGKGTTFRVELPAIGSA
jgi:signal transduction histidine kinase